MFRTPRKVVHFDAMPREEYEAIKEKILSVSNLESDLPPLLDDTVGRPTVASARRSLLWTTERRIYEHAASKSAQEFQSRPYARKKYPMISKHYPGTWRVIGGQKMNEIVARLSKPTLASLERAKAGREKFRDDGRYTPRRPASCMPDIGRQDKPTVINKNTEQESLSPRRGILVKKESRSQDYNNNEGDDEGASTFRGRIDSTGSYVIGAPTEPLIFWYPEVDFKKKKRAKSAPIRHYIILS